MTFKKIIFLLLIFSFNTNAVLKIVTTTPDLAYMANQIGGKLVQVESLLDGTEDPHYIDAMPHFIAKAASADIFCQVGMSLESGWAPKILIRSGNANIQGGGKGFCIIGNNINAIEIPTVQIDRSMGDLHAQGNPHFQLSPDHFLQGAQTMLEILINNDEKNASIYLENFQKFEIKIKNTKKEITEILKQIKNKNFLQFHREFSYFLTAYGLNNLGALEETPGIPPSAGRLARLSIKMKNKNVKAVMATRNSPMKTLEKYKQMSNIPYLILPIGIMTKDGPKDYHSLQLYIANKIIKN